MKGFISLELLNRLQNAIDGGPAYRFYDLLNDIYEEVKPGPALCPVSELGILHFAEGQWGVKPLDGVLLKACAELGEAADAVIKHGEGRDTLEHADMEVGDVLVVLSQYAAKRGTTLDGLRAAAFQKCKDRVVRMAMIEEDNALAKFVPPVSMFDQLMSRLDRVPQMGENLNGEEDDHPLWGINAQIVDLMGGGAASEDHRDILSFLRSTGLPESTVKRMHLALCNAETPPKFDREVMSLPETESKQKCTCDTTKARPGGGVPRCPVCETEAEQEAFENWLEAVKPSGDVESVRRQWEDYSPVEPEPAPRGYEGQDLDDLFAEEPNN